MTSLEVQGVCKHYGAVEALHDVNLSVAAGSRAAIVGPSGSGKTTLLRIIAGFEAPDAGRVLVGNQLLANGPEMVPAHRRGIGFVPQDGALFPHLSIFDNVGFGLPRSTPHRRQRIAELMDMVALDAAMLKRRPHELSGGQQQRVALARALAQQPRLMLLDEPFSALDTGLRASTRKAVAELLNRVGITTILVTHDQAEALSFADQVAVMRVGRLVQTGSPLELYNRPLDAAVASFLGDSIVLAAQLSDGWAECALGRLAVNGKQQGLAHIMLRPEQLRISEVSEVTDEAALLRTDTSACYGQVLASEFGGSGCTLSIRLLRGPADKVAAEDATFSDLPLQVKTLGLHAAAVGAVVRITVDGQAHVLAENSA